MAALGVVDRSLQQESAELALRASLVPGLDARLVLIDADAGVDKFHVLQGLEDPELPDGPERYFCFQRWGDTGCRGSNKLDGPLPLPKVEALIAQVFKDKTGEAWGSVEPGQGAKPGMYWPQQLMKPDAQARWEYFVGDRVDGKTEGWYPYTPEAMDEVEELYAQHVADNCSQRTATRTVWSGHFSYRVDLADMQQTNTRTEKVRSIRRVFGPKGARRDGGSGRRTGAAASKRRLGVVKRVPRTPKKVMRKIAKKPKAPKMPSKIAKGKRARHAVFRGKSEKTKSGLRKDDFVKNKAGRIVPKKKSALGKLNKWCIATAQARKEMGISGFVAVGGKSSMGKALLEKARHLYSKK